MYQLLLLTLLVTNGKLDVQQTKVDTFYTLGECQNFKKVLEDKTLLKLNDNKENKVLIFECRREI